jgi:DNA-binding MarR family transcriptional regulator
MTEELQFEIMRYLSDRLSTTMPELEKAYPQGNVKEALGELERKGFVHRVGDPIAGHDLISPTSKGLLRIRQNSSVM